MLLVPSGETSSPVKPSTARAPGLAAVARVASILEKSWWRGGARGGGRCQRYLIKGSALSGAILGN